MNFAKRFARELEVRGSSEIKVEAPPEQKYSAWVGGAIVGSLVSFSSMAITRDEYDEYGAALIHQKCS